MKLRRTVNMNNYPERRFDSAELDVLRLSWQEVIRDAHRRALAAEPSDDYVPTGGRKSGTPA